MANSVMTNIFSFSLVSLFLTLTCCKSETPLVAEHLIVPEIEVIPPPRSIMWEEINCPDDMVYIPYFNFCIDRYEAPNKKGAKPLAAQSAYQAVDYCKSIGKRLCAHAEWNISCTGLNKKTYPYGMSYKKGTCNDNKTGWVPVPWNTMGTPAWDKFCKAQYKGEPSGNREGCVSDYGVYDMTGNVAEWVVEPKNPHGYVVKGGYWYGVLQGTPSCGFVNPAHSPGFNSYEFGFRCCKDAG